MVRRFCAPLCAHLRRSPRLSSLTLHVHGNHFVVAAPVNGAVAIYNDDKVETLSDYNGPMNVDVAGVVRE